MYHFQNFSKLLLYHAMLSRFLKSGQSWSTCETWSYYHWHRWFDFEDCTWAMSHRQAVNVRSLGRLSLFVIWSDDIHLSIRQYVLTHLFKHQWHSINHDFFYKCVVLVSKILTCIRCGVDVNCFKHFLYLDILHFLYFSLKYLNEIFFVALFNIILFFFSQQTKLQKHQ